MSIAFSKLHQRQEVIAMIRHSETRQRLSHNHSNQDIDKGLTESNVDYKGLGYIGTINAYDKRLAQIDKHNPNKRKDRVTCFELVIPFPDVTKERWKECQEIILNFLHWTFGINLINALVHYDEIHPYYKSNKNDKNDKNDKGDKSDKGEIVQSRPHVHCYVIPEIDGKLNGKKFSARANMIKLNRQLNEEFIDKMGVRFLTGETPRKKSVEQLKLESYQELSAELEKKKAQVQELTKKLDQLNNLDELAELYQRVYDEEFERSLIRKRQKSR